MTTQAADDATLATVVGELVQGMRAGADELFVEERLHVLAAHLTAVEWQDEEECDLGLLGEARLRRALEFISAALSARLRLKDIALEAGISVFHFAQMFRQATGRPLGVSSPTCALMQPATCWSDPTCRSRRSRVLSAIPRRGVLTQPS